MKLERWAILGSLLWVSHVAAVGGVIYVDDDAAPGGDGLSWKTAYRYLQDALRTAQDDDEIRIAGGVYTPDRCESCAGLTPGDRLARFMAPDLRLTIEGDFRGLTPGGDPDDQDADAFETMLSGDLNGDDGPEFANYGDNSEVVFQVSSGELTLQRVTLRGANGNGGFACAALVWDGGNTVIDQVRFSDNFATGKGAGAFVFRWNEGESILISNCRFTRNLAYRGGAMFVETIGSGDSARISDCTFLENVATSDGGALSVQGPRVERCVFRGNSAMFGGAIDLTGEARLVDCRIVGNSATRGGGISVSYYGAVLEGCVIKHNEAAEVGGGVGIGADPLSTGPNRIRIVNSQIVANVAAVGGGIWRSAYQHPDALHIETSVLAANRAYGYPGASAWEGGGAFRAFGGRVRLLHCDVAMNWAAGTEVRGGALTFVGSEFTVSASRFAGNLIDGTASVASGAAIHCEGHNPRMQNAIFAGNGGQVPNEGAISIDEQIWMSNCNLIENQSGGLRNLGPESVRLDSSILWGNSPAPGESVQDAQVAGLVDVNYSAIQGLDGSLGGSGNIGGDPRFTQPLVGVWTAPPVYDPNSAQTTFFDVQASWPPNGLARRFLNPDTGQMLQSIIASNTQTTVTAWGDLRALGGPGAAYAINDYQIQGDSPCIDAGDSAAVQPDRLDEDGDGDMVEPVPVDADGCWRFDDVASVPDTGVGPAPIVDIGAYEAHDCVGDLNNDGIVGVDDLATMLANFGTIGRVTFCDGDLDGDAAIGLSDLAAQLAAYGQSCE